MSGSGRMLRWATCVTVLALVPATARPAALAGAGAAATPAAVVTPEMAVATISQFLQEPAAPSLAPADDGAGRLALGRPGGSDAAAAGPAVLSAARARILLRSLTVPGWGQATIGHRTSATFFGLAETAIWGSFVAFRIQTAMREQAYERTARIRAGIDVGGRDEEWRRIVGGFSSSDEYNLLVVTRDAANLYYDDPVAYRQYIAEHSLTGADSWHWLSEADQTRYRDQRRAAQRAVQYANTALAAAIVNRFASALHAARAVGHDQRAARSWQLEVVPGVGEDPLAFQLRVRANF